MIVDDVMTELKTMNARQQRSIMLGIPMFGGMCHGDFALSVVKSVQVLTRAGFEVSIEVMMGDSLIPRARNNLAQRFLASGKDMLMFLDADIVFGEWDIIKLILGDHDLVAATYPRKRLNLEAYKEAVLKLKDSPEDWLGSYIFKADSDGQSDELGFLEVSHVPTGFMLIQRIVFERLQQFVPSYVDIVDGQRIDAWDYFSIGPVKGQYMSEDYSFCQAWRQAGGKIHLAPFIQLKHIGSYAFDGNLMRQGSEAL